MNIQAVVYWVLTLCSDVTGSSPWRWRQQGPPKRWYLTTIPHGVKIQKPHLL